MESGDPRLLSGAGVRVALRARERSFGCVLLLEPRVGHLVAKALEDDLREETRAEDALAKHAVGPGRDDDLALARKRFWDGVQTRIHPTVLLPTGTPEDSSELNLRQFREQVKVLV